MMGFSKNIRYCLIYVTKLCKAMECLKLAWKGGFHHITLESNSNTLINNLAKPPMDLNLLQGYLSLFQKARQFILFILIKKIIML